jgi:pilus assembly protein CpaC
MGRISSNLFKWTAVAFTALSMAICAPVSAQERGADPANMAGQPPIAADNANSSAFSQQPTAGSSNNAGQLPIVAGNVPTAAFSQQPTAGSALHIVIGRSVFINTGARVSRIFVANPAVLESYTVSPHQVVITAKATGVSSLILWDENGRSQSYQVSSDLDVDDLSAALHTAFPADDVHVHGSESRAVLTGNVGTQASSDAVAKLAAIYTKDVSNALVIDSTRVKQVRLKVRVVEIDRARLEQFGINIFSQGGSNIAGSTTGQFPSTATLGTPTVVPGASGGASSVFQQLTVSDPLNFLFFSSKYNIGVTVRDLQNKNILQILAEPNITTLSGEKANFLAGGEFPFPVIQGGVGAATSVTIQFRPYGVKVEFLPIVNADGTIELHVAPEVSALDYSNAVSISGYTIPAISTRRAETQVTLRSGQSFAIGGLLDQRTTDLYGRTPGFSSVPILGQLFKSKSVNHTSTDLVVIVTPEIVDPVHDNSAPEQPFLPVPMLDNKPFDQSLPKGALGPPPAAPAAPVAATAAVEAFPRTTVVQVATISNQVDADAILAALKKKGYAATEESYGNLIHIEVGPFSNRKDADDMSLRLARDGYNPVVLDSIARS